MLHATIIRQYIGADKQLAENGDMLKESDKAMNKGVIENSDPQEVGRVEFAMDGKNSTIIVQAKPIIIAEKENEVKKLREQYIDTDLDDDEDLKLSLKKQIQDLRKEIALLKEGLENE